MQHYWSNSGVLIPVYSTEKQTNTMRIQHSENNNTGGTESMGNIHPYESTPDKMLTIKDVTKAMRVSEGTVRLWMYGKGLPFFKIGGRVWIREVDLAQWLSKYRVVIKPISERVNETDIES